MTSPTQQPSVLTLGQNHTSPGWKERVWYKGFGMVLTIAMLANTYLSSRVVTSVETQEKVVGGRLENLQKTSDDTHTLVNANMGFQLKVGAVALRRNADYSKLALETANAENKDAAVILAAEKLAATDYEIAILAERLLAEHIAKQASVDAAKAKSLPSHPEIDQNVKDVKSGVGKIQKDVTVIKDQVIKDVKEGVKKGIEEAKEDAK